MKLVAILTLTLCLSACMTAAPISPRPSHWANQIKADANFYQVDNKLYRSEQPIGADVSTIHAHAIKTIINLRQGQDDNPALFGDTITLIKEPLITWRVKLSDIARILYTIEKHQKTGAVLIHCRHGADRTGIVIAMYRVIYQGMSINEARTEMKYGDYGYHLIWKNLDNLLSETNINQVKHELNRLKSNNPI